MKKESFNWERPYQHDSTASRLLSEVKHVRAWLVLRWGTTLESQVLFSFCLFPSRKAEPSIRDKKHEKEAKSFYNDTYDTYHSNNEEMIRSILLIAKVRQGRD